MKTILPITLLAILTLWVSATAVRIEWLNAQAGYYLPRKDGGADGKWRQTPYPSAHNSLRNLVGSVGLLQYLLAPLTVALGLFLASRRIKPGVRVFAALCGVIAIVSWSLAFYRAYFTSIGP